MPMFHYRAVSPAGDVSAGSIAAGDVDEATHQLQSRGLALIEDPREVRGGQFSFVAWAFRPRPEDVTVFTADLALLLRTGARINEALELLAADAGGGRLRPLLAELVRRIHSGESFAEAIAKHPETFPPLYGALVRVGEAAGALAAALEAVAVERQRAEALKRRLADALRYPAFLLLGAGAVLLFFLLAVLPQFANVFRDFNAKLDPTLAAFLALSEALRAHFDAVALTSAAILAAAVVVLSRSSARAAFARAFGRLPFVSVVTERRTAALFCRNLALMLSSGVRLPDCLRILADMRVFGSDPAAAEAVAARVRQGGRLSDALAEARILPPLAVRTLRLGEQSGQLPALAARVADYYEAKLQRALDRVVGVVGPAAIIVISLIVGGLIVSVMTALLSVNQAAM
jgi:general secretion pathway protein F